jgi:diguanylate cyclase (GGDEF)-like protein
MRARRDTVIWACTAAIAACAAAVQWFAVPHASASPDSWPWIWPVLVTAGFLGAELVVVHLRLGRDAYTFSLMEIPLVLGLFFVRPDLLVLCRLAGAGLAFIWQRKAVQKAAFNCSMFALETAGAVAIWNAVLGDHDQLSPRAWLATLLAVLFTSALGSTLVSTVITISTGHRPHPAVEVFSLGQLGDLANATFALVAVYVLSQDWRAGWMLLVFAAVLIVAYRSYEGARRRSESLEQLNRFTELVGREVQLEAVVHRVMVEARAAFDVEVVQLRLSRPGEQVRDWVLQGDVAESGNALLVTSLEPLVTVDPLLLPRQSRSAQLSELAEKAGVRDCLAAPLRSEGRRLGTLVVADRLGDVQTFTRADVKQIQALANHAAVAIDNAARADLIIRQAAEREHRAMHDDLTGLANRRLFSVRLAESLAQANASVLLLDLDHFKQVNDTLGHEVGDRLLCQVAERMIDALSPSTLVARFGGDEFAVLVPGADILAARACAELVRDALRRPFDLDGLAVAVEASVGVAAAARADDPISVVRWADLAMYAAKEARSGVEAYRDELDHADSSRLGLLADLRMAVAANALDVHYQPKVDVKTGQITGVEALARWQHPSLGRIGPDEFIPLAEQSSLITPLTMLVLRTALRDCETWRRTMGPTYSVAVNIAPRSLLDSAFVDEVARALAVVAVPASALTLEITETSLMADPNGSVVALHRLRELGVRVAVDDLGTGYSSLAYLQRLPVDEIKIDRSFLAEFSHPQARAVVRAIVDLGHGLGRHVVAEGIEDEETFQALRELGCDTAQGFWLARPLPFDELISLVEQWRLPNPTSGAPGSSHLRRVR